MLKVIFVTLCQWMPCEHAEIATRQSVLETGWFKSEACIERCNPFGLMWKGNVQTFESIEESCVQYYKQIYLQYKGGDYYEFLDSIGYAEDSLYIWKLKHIDINAVHNTTMQQRDNSVPWWTNLLEGKVLQGDVGRGLRAHWSGRSQVPFIMGLGYSSMVKNQDGYESRDGYKLYQRHRYRRYRKITYYSLERIDQLV